MRYNKHMAMRLSDIAKMVGVSKSTVSRAFSHPEMLDEKTLNRILDIARMFNYHPNSMAQAVARQRSGLIGFLQIHKSRPFYSSHFYGPALDGFAERAKARGYHIVLGSSTNRDEDFEESFIKDSIEGAVLITRDPESLAKVFKARKIPIVLLNDEVGLDNLGCVVGDDYGGIRKIMTHLIDERGYEDIVFCSNRLSHFCNMQRYLAYVDSMAEHGLAPFSDPDLPEFDILSSFTPNAHVLSRYGRNEIPRFGTPLIFSTTDTETVEKEMLKMMPLLKRLPRAFVCVNDHLAIGLANALKKRGIRIPKDVAITGFDDIEMASFYTPTLTTIHADAYRMGSASMDLLYKYILDPLTPSKRICIQGDLIVRESS